MNRPATQFAPIGCLATLVVALGFLLGAAAQVDGLRHGPAFAPSADRESGARLRTRWGPVPGEPRRPSGGSGEVVVVGAAQGLPDEAARLGLEVVEHQQLGAIGAEFYRLAVPRGGTAAQVIAALRTRFPAAGIDANRVVEPAAGTMDSGLVPESWARSAIGWAPAAPDCGRGLRIGMIDAAVDVSHPALAGQHIEYRSFHNPDRQPSEAVHGTAIAAMLIGHPSHQGWGGILPGAELKAANVFEYNEEGRLVGNAVAMLKAFDWMVAEGVQVVNLSMAGQDNEALRYVIDYARKHGLVSVAAAGNWGRAEPTYPAAYDGVIAVTAFGPGGGIYKQANRGPFIDFAAPGVEMWTAVPHGGRVQSGTSFAVPYVTAQVAVEIAHGTARDADEIRRVLETRVTDMGAPGRDDDYGWGFIAGAPSCS
jgi:subtilisin family serine protease